MKIILIIISMSLISCQGIPIPLWEESDNDRYVLFSTFSKVPDTFTEVHYLMKEFQGDSLVVVNTVYFNARNKDGTDETFAFNDGFAIGFSIDSVALVSDGLFEAVALKKDSSLIRKEFGRIVNGRSQKRFTVLLKSEEIIIK